MNKIKLGFIFLLSVSCKESDEKVEFDKNHSFPKVAEDRDELHVDQSLLRFEGVPEGKGIYTDEDREFIKKLIKESNGGSPRATYQLYRSFSFAYHEPALAYYWATRMKELGHPVATPEFMVTAGEAVLNEIDHCIIGNGE